MRPTERARLWPIVPPDRWSEAAGARLPAATIRRGHPIETMTSSHRAIVAMAAGAIILLGGCNRSPLPSGAQRSGEPEPVTVDIPQAEVAAVPGTTPMAQRVAVIGVL